MDDKQTIISEIKSELRELESKLNKNNPKGSGAGIGPKRAGNGEGSGRPKIEIFGKEIDLSAANIRDCIIDASSKEFYKGKMSDPEGLKREMLNQKSSSIKKAIQIAKKEGNLNKTVESLFAKMEAGEIPSWLEFFERFMTNTPQVRRPNPMKAFRNRKTQQSDYQILYDFQEPQKADINKVLFAVDTSGSISGSRDIPKFLSQVKGIMNEYEGVISGGICSWGSNIEEYITFDDISEIPDKLELRDGGGTSIMSVFDDALQRDEYRFLIVYTDGEFFDWDKFEKINPSMYDLELVIWVLYSKDDYVNFKPNFGIKCLLVREGE